MKINFFNDYDKTTNNDDILYLYIYENNESYKAFKILPRIYIVPEIITDISNAHNHYIKKYLQTSKSRSKYLAQISTLFKRLNSKPLGKQLLRSVTKAIPFNMPLKHNPSNSLPFSNVAITNPKDSQGVKEVNLIISVALPDIFDISTIPFTQHTPPYSSYSIMNMIPDLLIRSKDHENTYWDPIITLAHELLHVLRNNYAFWEAPIEIEENMVCGIYGANHNYEKLHKEYYENIAIQMDKICDILNDNIPGKSHHISEKLHHLYVKKYLLKKHKKEKLKVDENNLKALHYLLSYKFTEHEICKAFNVFSRVSYYDYNKITAAILDTSNPSVYSIEKGLLIQGRKLKDHPSMLSNKRKHK